MQTNFWFDIPAATNKNARYSNKLYLKILDASSFKLNWVLDPFMKNGDILLSLIFWDFNFRYNYFPYHLFIFDSFIILNNKYLICRREETF